MEHLLRGCSRFLGVREDGTNEESSLTHDHLTVQFQALVCMPIGSVTENRCDRIFITAGNNALRDIPAKDTSISIDLVFAFLTISSKLSGTYQSACIAAADFDNIFVVDSMSAAIGSGILAKYALRRAEEGLSAKQLADEITKKRDDVCLVALLDTLEYLKKGGLISKTAAIAGGILNIKPVLTVQDGAPVVIGKARGSKQGNNLLVEKIHNCGGIDFSMPILLGYSGLSDIFLKKYVDDSRALWQDKVDSLDSTLLCSVIGTHTGPGVVAVAFFKNSSN